MESLRNLHSFKLESYSKSIVYIEREQDILTLIEREKTCPYFILGEGSNTVFLQDFNGTVFVNRLRGIEVSEHDSHFKLNVNSGENWHELVKFCLNNNIHGFENLALIPGTVGAAPLQNIGAYGLEIEKFIEAVHFIDLDTGLTHSFSNGQCQFGYRDSIFKQPNFPPFFITSVTFLLPKQQNLVLNYAPLDKLDNPSPREIFDLVVKTRKHKLPDPSEIGNAGSFFKNPIVSNALYEQICASYDSAPCYPNGNGKVKIPAAWLIEQAGFKGLSFEGVCCYVNQPLVLTNCDHATGKSLLAFAKIIKARVFDMFSIELENEVRLIDDSGVVVL